MNARLIVHQPKLVVSKNVARVSCDITEKGASNRDEVKKTVTFDVDKKWGKYLVVENINAYLIACLPYAMRNQMDIELLAPVSSELLHNLEMYLIPHLAKYDTRLHPTKIYTKHIEPTSLKNAGAVGTGMSMGVDSFYTVHQYINPKYKDLKLTHLLVEQVGDLVEGITSEKHKRNVNGDTVDKVANALGLPVVHTYSNFRQLFKMKHLHTHTYTAMFNVHMMAKLFKIYFYSSADDYSHFSLIDNSTHGAGRYELLSLHALSTDSLRLLSGGAASDRIEKTRGLADNDVARNFLRVCLMEELNCMHCSKCRRTLLTLDMQGNLDEFKNVFDIAMYKRNKEAYLKWLIRSYHKNSQGNSIIKLYNFFYSSEKNIMERLESRHLKNFKPLKVPSYFRAKTKIHKINPSTGKKYRSTIKEGEDIYFADELYINGVCYLRSREDSHRGKDQAVLMSSLREIEFQPLKKPTRLKTTRKTRKVNPHTGADYKKEIKTGTKIVFVDSITVDGVRYLRTRHDSLKNRNLAIPRSSLVKVV